MKILLKYMMSNLFPPTTPINSTNPGTVFGFGTWELWGSGRVPVCVNTSDSNFNSVEKTGGSASHSLTVSEMPHHRHYVPSFMTVDNAGQHIHYVGRKIEGASGSSGYDISGDDGNRKDTTPAGIGTISIDNYTRFKGSMNGTPVVIPRSTYDSGGVVSLQMRHNGTQWILEVCSIINGQKYHMHFIPDSGLQSGW